jgi:hypothetical protein
MDGQVILGTDDIRVGAKDIEQASAMKPRNRAGTVMTYNCHQGGRHTTRAKRAEDRVKTKSLRNDIFQYVAEQKNALPTGDGD